MVAEERLAPVPLALLPVERLTLPPEEEEERVVCCWLLPEERLAEVVERRSCWADVRTGVPVVWVTVVVVEERVPEMSAGKHSNVGVLFFSLGFTLMMALDVALG